MAVPLAIHRVVEMKEDLVGVDPASEAGDHKAKYSRDEGKKTRQSEYEDLSVL